MEVPPSFADLGKATRNLLSKGYDYGAVKLEAKSRTSTGLEITTGGNSHLGTGKISGGLELKLPVDTNATLGTVPFTLKGKWTTDNAFHTELSIEDQIVKGLKFAVETAYAIPNAKKTGKIKAAYKRHHVNSNIDVNFNFAGPTVDGAIVLGYRGFLAGYHLAYDTASPKLTKSNFGFGYAAQDFQFTSIVANGTDFQGSISHKVNSALETAVSFAWNKDSPTAPSFIIGAKYNIEKDTSISAKINQASALGLSFSQVLRPGVKLTLSSLIDVKNFDAGGHLVGLSLNFDS